MEEVVGVPVYRKYGIGGRRRTTTTQQRRVDTAFAVGIVAQRNGEFPVAGQDVGLPASHTRQLKASQSGRGIADANLAAQRVGPARDNLTIENSSFQ